MCVTLNLLLCGALHSGNEVVQRLLLNLVLERLPLRVSKQRRNSLYCRCSYELMGMRGAEHHTNTNVTIPVLNSDGRRTVLATNFTTFMVPAKR